MLDPFGDQRPALTADLPTVLLLGRGCLCHGADPRLAALVGQQGSDQSITVDPVRLDAPATARGGYGSLDEDDLHALMPADERNDRRQAAG